MKNNHLELFWRQCFGSRKPFQCSYSRHGCAFYYCFARYRGAVTVQAEASNSFGGSGSEEDDSYQDFAASEFSLVLDEADLLTDEEESQLLDKWKPSPGNTIWKWQLPQ